MLADEEFSGGASAEELAAFYEMVATMRLIEVNGLIQPGAVTAYVG